MRTVHLSDNQPALVEAFVNNLANGTFNSDSENVRTAGKLLAAPALKLQQHLVKQLLKMNGISVHHGSVGDLIDFIKQRIAWISRYHDMGHNVDRLKKVVSDYEMNNRYIQTVVTIPNVDAKFYIEGGHYGMLIYQIDKTGKLIENIFQCDWDVSNPTDPDNWLSLLYGHGLVTVDTLRMYLNGHERATFNCKYDTFEKLFYSALIKRLVGSVPTMLKDTLHYQAQSLGIAQYSKSRVDELRDSVMYSKLKECENLFPLKDIHEALIQMHVDNAPYMTEAAFFEQWEHRSYFNRLDSILYGYKPDTLGYVIKLKGRDQYVFIEITGGKYITLVSILNSEHRMYLHLPRWCLEDKIFLDSVGGKLEFEGFSENDD